MKIRHAACTIMLILITLVPATAQTALNLAQPVQQANVIRSKALNDSALEAMSNRDYATAEIRLIEAYQIALKNNDVIRVRTSLGNLISLYDLQGRHSEKKRVETSLQFLTQPRTSMNALQQDDLTRLMKETEEAWQQEQRIEADRQTAEESKRKEEEFELEKQQQYLEAKRQRQQESDAAQMDRQIMEERERTNRLLTGTDYFSRHIKH